MYYLVILILKKKLYIMKISPFFFAETLAELGAVVLHTRMYTDGCLNNVYIT